MGGGGEWICFEQQFVCFFIVIVLFFHHQQQPGLSESFEIES